MYQTDTVTIRHTIVDNDRGNGRISDLIKGLRNAVATLGGIAQLFKRPCTIVDPDTIIVNDENRTEIGLSVFAEDGARSLIKLGRQISLQFEN